MQPLTKPLLFSLEGTVSHVFLAHVSGRVLEPTFYRLLIKFSLIPNSILTPLGSLFGVNFPSLKKVTRFFSKCSWGGGICDTSEIRGELETSGITWEASGGICSASGRHRETSGGIWEASGGIWRHLRGIWRHLEASGRHLGVIWEASGDIWRHLGGIWKHLEASERHLEASGGIWEASGGHMGRRLGGIWRHLGSLGSQGVPKVI